MFSVRRPGLGIPDLVAQERRDRADRGAYRQMHAAGALHVADGLRVPPVDLLVSIITAEWGPPAAVLCDRFRLAELQDAVPGWPLEPRRGMWPEASEDVRGTRRLGLDGPLSIAKGSRALLLWSLMVSRVETDDAGNARLVKRALDGRSKDDVAQSLVLAAGAVTGAERGPDGKYPERPATDPRIPLAAFVKTAAARAALRRGFRALVTTSDSSEQETARWREGAAGERAAFDVETVDPGRETVAARLADPETGELSAECSAALSRWYRGA